MIGALAFACRVVLGGLCTVIAAGWLMRDVGGEIDERRAARRPDARWWE